MLVNRCASSSAQRFLPKATSIGALCFRRILLPRGCIRKDWPICAPTRISPPVKLLQKSIAIEPSFALAHVALAEAWSALGYDARAVASAQQALSLANSLPEDVRFEIEGRYYELKQDWPGAIGVYRHLWRDFPDDLDSGLKLAAAQASAGNTNEALATLSSLRSFPGLEDPRIDLTEASIAARNKDYRRQQVLAEKAVEKARRSGARLLMARAHLLTGAALHHQSKLTEASNHYSAAELIFEEAGDRDGSATALTQLGIVLGESGDLAGAQKQA